MIALLFCLLQDVASGPKVGDMVAKLPVLAVTGLIEDKEADYVAERKDAQTIYVFIQRAKWERPMARFLRELDTAVAKRNDVTHVCVVFLTDDPKAVREYLPKAQQSLQFEHTSLGVYDGDTGGPKGWGINSDAHLTAVVAAKGKVVAVAGFNSVNETDVKSVLKSLKKD